MRSLLALCQTLPSECPSLCMRHASALVVGSLHLFAPNIIFLERFLFLFSFVLVVFVFLFYYIFRAFVGAL